MSNLTEIDECLRGHKLYGDDFTMQEIDAWFSDERQGYFNLSGAANKEQYEYGYHALNYRYGFSNLPDVSFSQVLGIGSAYGDELRPIIEKSKHIHILEPAEGFVVEDINGVPVTYSQPQPSGILPYENDQFDLITCFGVLHHIPNVTTVINEMYRCLKPGGYILIREPISSMGDWRKQRVGLTKRERGIPLHIFRKIILAAGFEVIKEQKCMFSLTSRLRYLLKGPVYNSNVAIWLDKIICKLPLWSNAYNPISIIHKLRPASVFYVVKK